MSLSEEKAETESISDEDEDDSNINSSVEQNELKSYGKNVAKEAMRDVLVCVILIGLTSLVTHGDFQKSQTPSILASGKYCIGNHTIL